MKTKDKLKGMYACSEAVKWVGNRSITRAWNECQVGTWMLWLAHNLHNYRNKPLNKAAYTNIKRAIDQRNTGLSPAERVRKVVSAGTIARAFNKFTTY